MRETFITKTRQLFITKCDDFITQCGVYYKMPQCNGQCKVTYVRKGCQKHFLVVRILKGLSY